MSKFTEFLGFKTREATPTPQNPQSLPPSRSLYDLRVESALSVSSINRAVGILTTHATQLELGTFRGDTPINSSGLIQRPDYDTHRSDWIKSTVFSMATYGNAYWQVFTDDNNSVTKLKVLRPDTMTITRDINGNLFYNYSGYTQPAVLTPYRSYAPSANTVVHLKLTEVPWSYYGQGPLQLCRQELQGLLQLRDYVNTWFDTSGIPSGILTTKDYIDPVAAAAYKEEWYKTLKDGGTAVLGNNLSYEPTVFDPAKSQFVDVQQLSIAAVARMYGIPASLMLAPIEESTDTYANLQQENQKFVTGTLMQYLKPIEDNLSDFVPNTQQVKFDLSGLLRADDTTRITNYQILVNLGVLAPEEVRDQEDLGPKNPNYTYITPEAALKPGSDKE